MPPEEIKAGDQPTGPDPLAGIRTILTGAGRSAKNVEETIRQLISDSDELATLRDQTKDLAEVRRLADDGRKYRTDLIDDAIAEGVRAHGADFAQETYRGTLETSSLDTIKLMRDDWKRLADSKLKSGRQTQDATDAQPAACKNDVPDTAYRDV